MTDNRLTVDLDGIEAKLNWGTDEKEDKLVENTQSFLDEIKRLRDEIKDEDLSDEKEKERISKIRTLEKERHREEAKVMYDFEACDNELPDLEWFCRPNYPKRQHEYNLMVFRNPSILI